MQEFDSVEDEDSVRECERMLTLYFRSFYIT